MGVCAENLDSVILVMKPAKKTSECDEADAVIRRGVPTPIGVGVTGTVAIKISQLLGSQLSR
jgi:hypothetical protein